MVRFLTPPEPPARLRSPPVRGSALVFAPHPDDETIGPGGTLVQHVEAGQAVNVVFLTAGGNGDPTGRAEPAEYARRREQEARAAAAVLGLGALEFWGLPDNFRVNENDLNQVLPRVVDAIERFAPDVVYAPHDGEQHSDHFTAAVLVRRALHQVKRPPLAYGYEVWSASQAALVVDTSRQYVKKMAALKCYASQLEHTDIERFITGLNAYRAVFLEKGAKFGEAFVPLVKSASAGFA